MQQHDGFLWSPNARPALAMPTLALYLGPLHLCSVFSFEMGLTLLCRRGEKDEKK